ncbi:alkaline phosphatase, partial [Mycobacterium tuberculosis]|nr:alkaline phosphatase [Mycobacterium tuberculosis]
VILFVGDGLSIAQRTAARLLSKGMVEGRYAASLAMEDMPYMALVSTSGTDTLVTDSANSMSAYTTGHKSCNNALGVYCAKNKNNLEH